MKFNPNQRYTRWSIRRLSVGVASVVVASGFFVLVGQPSSVRADVLTDAPALTCTPTFSGVRKDRLAYRNQYRTSRYRSSNRLNYSDPKTVAEASNSPEPSQLAQKEDTVVESEAKSIKENNIDDLLSLVKVPEEAPTQTAPEDLENIFKRLYRVETSRNMKTGGHGLGLAIARELAHQLGGEIIVTSQYGLGSTFTLVLHLSGNENKA